MREFVVTVFKNNKYEEYRIGNYDLANQMVTAVKTDPDVTQVQFTIIWERPESDVREEGVIQDDNDEIGWARPNVGLN